MLDPESEQIREVYAQFGLAIYSAQCLERELAMFLAASGTSERFTAWDYDDRLAGNFESTFGALVTFLRVSHFVDESLLSELEKAVDERNELIHRYFWNRAVEFNSTEGRTRMIGELEGLTAHFDFLDRELTKLVHDLMAEKGVTEDVLRKHLDALLIGGAMPHDPRRLRDPVTITAACEWRVCDSVESAILFASDAGNLVLGERGLCFGPQGIPAEHLKVKTEFAKALPATVDPKPKKASSWNYVIQLANNYELRVRPDERDGKQVVRFGLRSRKAETGR